VALDFLTLEEFLADLELDEPETSEQAAAAQRCVTQGNEMVAARVRMWSDGPLLARGSPHWRRLKYPASSAARALWFERLSDLKKSEHMMRNFERQMQPVEADLRAELGRGASMVVVGRDWAGEVPLTPGGAARGGYVVRAFNQSRAGGW